MCSVQDFPGGPVVRDLPCSAGDMGSIPGQGCVEQLSPCMYLEPRLQQEKLPQGDPHPQQLEGGPTHGS